MKLPPEKSAPQTDRHQQPSSAGPEEKETKWESKAQELLYWMGWDSRDVLGTPESLCGSSSLSSSKPHTHDLRCSS